MSAPISSLTPISILSPYIPSTGGVSTLSVDTSILPFKVQTDANTIRLEISIYSQTLVFSNPVTGFFNTFSGTIPLDTSVASTTVQITGRNYVPNVVWATSTSLAVGYRVTDSNGNVQVVLIAGITGFTAPTWGTVPSSITTDGTVIWKCLGPIAITPTSKFTLLFFNSGLALKISPPSALRAYKGSQSCQLEWATPPFTGFLGVRAVLSTDSSGVTIPYTQFGDLVTTISRTSNDPVTSNTTTVVSGNTTTATTVTSTQTTNYSSIFVPTSAINSDKFYALFSTVIQDPTTNVVFESQQNGPLTCGFVNLKKVNPTDFLGLQRKEDIAGRMISQITRAYPQLDLTPRSELRDLVIDPIAVELSNMSVREWFSHMASSISAITQIDDANNDGISDSYSDSPIKQQISRAYGMKASDTQAFINKQFDMLGEQAGVVRGGSTTAVVNLTFYTYTKPLQSIVIPQGAIVATSPNSQTPALNFVTTGSASISPASASSFFDSQYGRYQVIVSAQCTTTGSIGNVGVGTITTVVSGGPQGWSVTNLVPANFGTDSQNNSVYAAQIQDRIVTGVDTGTRNGYLIQARAIPSIVAANVVAAGDLEMLRDWDPIRQKHVFGTVDLYVRGSSNSQQTETAIYQYQNTAPQGTFSAYTPLTLVDRSILKFSISGFSQLTSPLEQAVEVIVQRGGQSFYLGTLNSFIDNTDGFLFLNPNELAYQLVGNSVFVSQQPLVIAGVSATNSVAVNALQSASAGTYSIGMFARIHTPLNNVPTLQPIISVNSVTGNQNTGVVSPTSIQLVRTQDFLLNGGSQLAGDTILIPSSSLLQTTKNVSLTSSIVSIDNAMSVDVDSGANVVLQKTINGQVLPSLVVRSGDLSTLYTYGVDYTLVRTGRYNNWSLNRVSTGSIPAPASVNPPVLVVSYYKYSLYEQVTFVNQENTTLNGTVSSQLANSGFIHNVWMPESYDFTQLSLDGFNTNPLLATGLTGAGIAHDNRYIKVTLTVAGIDVVMREGIDFSLVYNSTSGIASLARILTGQIPTGSTVKVSYFINETFSISTQYPAFVNQLATQIAVTKHAAADVLVKSMIANPVDITMVVEISSQVSPDVIDAKIRSMISIVLDNVPGNKLVMSEVVRQVKSVTGVTNVQLPLIKFAKSDGAYDIGIVVPSQTTWNPLSSDPSFTNLQLPIQSFITNSAVLPDATIPGGGSSTAYVGLLYQGQAYRRATSVQDFLVNSTVPSFYIIGTNDQISSTQSLSSSYAQKILITIPSTIANPGLQSYFVTYQVFGEGGAKDIQISSTEYFVPGRIQLDYKTS